jgi:hypothetical protein
MARISVWFVRSALVHFAVGATAGAWGLAAKSGLRLSLGLPIRPFHVEVMLIGWVCQLAVGVALWILPFSRSVSQDRRFWVAWGLLNGGIVAVVCGKWGMISSVHVLGRIAELGAGGLLVWGLWPRLRALPRRKH